jgi:cysteine desulfurase/selenocysteine lyase
VISFVIDDPPVSSLDIGTQLDLDGIAVRTGHHCCQPVMDRFGIGSTTRASFAFYNTRGDVDALVAGVKRIVERARGKEAQKVKAPAAADSVEIKYPEAAATTVKAAADELAEVFEFLGDRDARNQYILELGEKLPAMPDGLKVEGNRVHGCMSTVHLFGRKRDGRIDFVADSDAHIVRGLIGVLEKLFAGQSAKDVLAFDVQGFFHRIGLEQFITVQRRTGLAGMVNRVRELAAK